MDRKEAVEWIEKAMEYQGLLPSEFWIDGKIGEAVDLAIEALQESQTTHDQMDACYMAQKQVTGKLKSPCDSLLTADSGECKEQKSKLDTDLISRQAAGKTFCALCNGKRFGECEYSNTCKSLRALQSVPSAEPVHGEWIPVSERLPETHTEYVTENPWTQVSIVQDTYQLSDPVLGFGKRKRDHGEDPMMAVVWYEDDGYDRTAWITAPDCEDIDVLAWMPLPEPYKGGDKE